MCTNIVMIYCMHIIVHGGGVVWPDRSAGLVVHLNRKYSILTCHILTRHKYMFGINFKYVKTQP